MAVKLLLICFVWVQVATTQYYAPGYYPYSNYYNNYYPPPPPSISPPFPTPLISPPRISSPQTSKTYQSSYYNPKYLAQTTVQKSLPTTYPSYTQYGIKSISNYPQTTSTTYYVSNKKEEPEIKVVKETKIQHKCPPSYNCPLCNGYKDVIPNSKVPPPPKNTPELPDLMDKISTIENEVKNEKKTLLAKIKEVCEKPGLKKLKDKLLEKPKSYRFDQDLLDGFLTGLGLSD